MINNYYFSSRRKSSLKSIAMLLLAFGLSLAFQTVKAQAPYQIHADSQVKIAVDSIKNNFTVMASANAINAQGHFIIKDGVLEDIRSFKLRVPVSNAALVTDATDSIGFEVTHVMVLPIMRLVHLVGVLEVGGVKNRTELDFNFTVNEDQSISLFGLKTIKMKEYNKETNFASNALKESAEVKMNLNLLFNNDQRNIVAIADTAADTDQEKK